MNSVPVTIVVPVYNESKHIEKCLESLIKQKKSGQEIIIVDDGSTDDTLSIINRFQKRQPKATIKIYSQKHRGPGEARNLAVKHSQGNILIFVDADMTFEKDFLKKIVYPIQKEGVTGTDSQAGKLANPDNYWARCWNLGKFAAVGSYSGAYLTEITPNKKNYGGVFRAILKSEFEKAGGFETGGDYTDDTSLAKKLNKKAKIVKDAVFYHWNPDTLSEVWLRARWIGAGKNFTGTLNKKAFNLLKFFPLLSPLKGLVIGLRFKYPQFLVFKIVFDLAIWTSIVNSL